MDLPHIVASATSYPTDPQDAGPSKFRPNPRYPNRYVLHGESSDKASIRCGKTRSPIVLVQLLLLRAAAPVCWILRPYVSTPTEATYQHWAVSFNMHNIVLLSPPTDIAHQTARVH